MTTAFTLTRRLEDSVYPDYDNLPFGSAGNDSSCSLTGYSENGASTWYYSCLVGTVYSGSSDQDSSSSTTTYQHKQSCWGQDNDLDNFSCRLAVHKFSEYKYYGEPDPFYVNVDCTGQDGCTCQGAAVDGVPCDVCSTCSTFSTDDVASWMKKNTIPETLELVCATGLSQSCPTATKSTSTLSTLPNDGEFGWSFGGFVVAVAATVAYVGWWKKRHSPTHAAPFIEPKTSTDCHAPTGGQLA